MMCYRAALAIAAVLVVLVGCSEYEQARRYYESGNYAEAAHRFEVLAAKGDTNAQFDLAHINFTGIGRPPDMKAGWRWLVAAANGGNSRAMVEVAMRYASGRGADQSLLMAVRWYRRAAALGEPIAAFNLASMYEIGNEVPKDMLRAYAWYVIASRKGNVAANERVDELRSKMLREDVERADALVIKLLSDPEA